MLVDADQQVERLPHGLRSPIRHERPPPRIGFHQSLFPQRLHRLAHRRAAHPKPLRQVPFRRQLVPGLQLPLENRLLHLLHNLFEQARRSHRPIVGSRSERIDVSTSHGTPCQEFRLAVIPPDQLVIPLYLKSARSVGCSILRRVFCDVRVGFTYAVLCALCESSATSALSSLPAEFAKPHCTHTVLIFMNSRIPFSASSRPCPEYFTPPKGSRGSDATILFRKTMPASSSLMNLSVSAGSLVQALAPSPKRLSLAICIA